LFGGYTGIAGGIEGVGFWPRAVARLLDDVVHIVIGFVTGIVFGIVVVVAAKMTGQSARTLMARQSNSRIEMIVFSLLGLIAFHTLMEGMHGSTPGKLAFKMVAVQEDGTPCRFKAAFIRSLGFYVDMLFFGLVGYLAMQKTPQQQRHGDSWADTIVCKRSAVQPQNLHGTGSWIAVFALACAADFAILMVGSILSIQA
jgi:uncharacterized RDD family membrane protein YckC